MIQICSLMWFWRRLLTRISVPCDAIRSNSGFSGADRLVLKRFCFGEDCFQPERSVLRVSDGSEWAVVNGCAD